MAFTDVSVNWMVTGYKMDAIYNGHSTNKTSWALLRERETVQMWNCACWNFCTGNWTYCSLL